jgi:predicted metalloprotease with PDZ domain
MKKKLTLTYFARQGALGALIACFFLCIPMAKAQKISFHLSMDEPHTHYFDVEVKLENLKNTALARDFVDIKMPTWAPGSYLIREFSKNVEGEQAKDAAGKALRFTKIDKNTWRVFTNKAESFSFSYKVYAYEVSVRTSYLDASHGFVSPTGVFVYPAGQLKLPSEVHVKPYKEWNEISTGLPMVNGNKWVRRASDFDVLFDSPIEIGTQQVIEFTAQNIPHRIAMYGQTRFNADMMKADMTKIIDEATKIFGENPCQDYTFIVHNLGSGSGGLEHLNSTVLAVNRDAYQTEPGYRRFMALVAHEYFHLWNVKRLRPSALGPFDYDKENYTSMLWVSEGFTAYYDNLLVRRAGLYGEDAYLRDVAAYYAEHENAPGSQVQSVAEASFDAWIKYYRRNENSNNSGISYYGSGARIASLLDLEILHSTQGSKSLDDVMRYMYAEYYKKLNRGFTDEEFRKAVEMFAGKKLDDFFNRHIYGTEQVNYNQYLAYAGLQLVVSKDSNPSLGCSFSDDNGKIIIRGVRRGTKGYDGGLNVGDEIIAIDGVRVGSPAALNNQVNLREVGQKVSITIARDGLLKEMPIEIGTSGSASYRIVREANPSEAQQVVYKKWVGSRQ